MKSQFTRFLREYKRNHSIVPPITVLVISLGILASTIVFMDGQAEKDNYHITEASELRVLSQQIAKNATEAASGKPEAFSQLKDARNQFDERFGALQNSLSYSLAGSNSPVISQINALDAAWSALKIEADSILAAEERIVSLHRLALTLAETAPQLQIEYDQIIELLLKDKVSTGQIVIAQRQPWLAERIIRNVEQVLVGGETAIIAADTLGQDTQLFGRVLKGMVDGNVSIGISQVKSEEVMDRLLEVADLFSFVERSTKDILKASPELFQAGAAADQIFTDSQQLLQQTSVLASTLRMLSQERLLDSILVIGAGIMVLLSLAFIASSANTGTQRRLAANRDQQDKNQKAIMRLLDEMEELADGNLTVNATVTEDFTGAIADSINHSIEQLRGLVKTINQTAVEVDMAAQRTQSTARELAEASEHQAAEINTATQSMNEMAQSIDNISVHAADSADVAQRSLGIASKGTEVVRNTIDGMNTIRGQIQDTSKRLKRLGESSQEIGNIVSLINDIADQTNILSLNASIQASMAGEAGRGFAVVADEVQRLSERVSAATRQIEGLVSTIQTDTNEAVISMEHTTAQVVHGAQLAQDAGVALEEIENVSSSLATLIHNISGTAKTQAASAAHISNRMKVIRDITVKTSSSTSKAAGSIGNLADMAVEMRKSVAGFRLQETES